MNTIHHSEVVSNPLIVEANANPVIEISNLTKSFGSQKVLKNISLKIFNKENLVVVGKSGSGKSVLIKCIVRLLNIDDGIITAFGENVHLLKGKALDSLRQKIGFLFQSGALYDSMTVKENLEFPLRRIKTKLSETEVRNKVEEVLENVGLADALNKMPSQLSGGMKKRVSLARTIIVDPLIMLYDEPTTGLDPVTSNEISLLINEIQKRNKTTSIIITHDMNCVRSTADRIVMLKDGEIYKNGNSDDFKNSNDPVIASFFS